MVYWEGFVGEWRDRGRENQGEIGMKIRENEGKIGRGLGKPGLF